MPLDCWIGQDPLRVAESFEGLHHDTVVCTFDQKRGDHGYAWTDRRAGDSSHERFDARCANKLSVLSPSVPRSVLAPSSKARSP